MRKTVVFLGVLAALSATGALAVPYTNYATFQAAAGPLTLEDFDSSPWPADGSVLTQPVVNLGVSWTSNDNLISTSVNPRSAPGMISDLDGVNNLDQIDADLPAGVRAAGGWIAGDNTVVMTAFDSSNAILEVVSNNSGGFFANHVFLGVTTNADIDRVELRCPPVGAGGADDFLLDDFEFGSADRIPEPTTLSLVALGLLGYLRRRKARR